MKPWHFSILLLVPAYVCCTQTTLDNKQLLCLYGTGCQVDSDCVGGSEGGTYCQQNNGWSQCLQVEAYTVSQHNCLVLYQYGCDVGNSNSCCAPGTICQNQLCQFPANNCVFYKPYQPPIPPTATPSKIPTFSPSTRKPTTAVPTIKSTVTPTVPTYQAMYDQCIILKQKAKTFIDSSTYPTSLAVVSNPSLTAGYLDPNVKARITPVGSFNGLTGVIEYFYGLTSIFAAVARQNIRRLVCEGNQVSVISDAYFLTSNPGTVTYPGPHNITVFAFLTFNTSTNLITSMDVVLPNFGFGEDIPATAVDPATNLTYHNENILFICGLTVYGQVGSTVFSPTGGTCQGANNIWGSPTDLKAQFNTCYYFLSTQVPYGSYNRLNSNTVVCRLLHSQLTLFDPAMHCPHVSPSGGNACIDFSAQSYYQVTY